VNHSGDKLRTCRFNGSAAVKIEEPTTIYRKVLELPPDPLEEEECSPAPQPARAPKVSVWKKAAAVIITTTAFLLMIVVALLAALRVEAYAERRRAEEREAVSLQLQNEWTELLEASFTSAPSEPSITPILLEGETEAAPAPDGLSWLYSLVLVNYIPGIY